MGSYFPSYLIVGAGCFGASTAYHLARTRPSSRITLIDRCDYPNPAAAAHDKNKIIRADYGDLVYMKLAREALESWCHDPVFRPYFHETGMLFVEDSGIGEKNLANYKLLFGEDTGLATVLKPDEARARFPIFAHAKWDGVKKIHYSPESGWGQADEALENVIRAAVDNGVIYNSEGVAKVNIDPETNGTTGVTTQSGKILNADVVILCAGAYTATLLADSSPHNKSMQVGERMAAAAAVSCYARVPANKRHLFQGAPVVFNGLDHTHGESVPMTPDGLLKFNYELSFTNKQRHELSNQVISVPPERPTQSTWSQDVPEEYKRGARMVMDHTYGDLVEGMEPEAYRMCWDAVTPNQDWIISPHPHSANLFIAAGGSFHAWKFLPNIGKYVIQMVEDRLEGDLKKKWAWDRSDEGAVCAMYIPSRDLSDAE